MTLKSELEKMSVQPLVNRKLQEPATNHATKTGELFLGLPINLTLSIQVANQLILAPLFKKNKEPSNLQSTAIFQSDVAHPKVSLGVLAGFHSEKKYFRKEFGFNVCHLEKQVTVFKISYFTSKKNSFSFLFPPFIYHPTHPTSLQIKIIYFNTKPTQNYY